MSDATPMAGTTDGESSPAEPVCIRQLVSQYHGAVFRYAYRLSGNQADAEDLVQQSFLIAQQKLHQLRQQEKARPWLFAILRSCFLKSRRRRQAVPAGTIDLEMEDVAEDPPEREELDHEQLQAALDELPEDFRLVLVMFYFDECSYKQISEELEIPIGTVMSRLSRGKAHLRRRLVGQPSASGTLDARSQ